MSFARRYSYKIAIIIKSQEAATKLKRSLVVSTYRTIFYAKVMHFIFNHMMTVLLWYYNKDTGPMSNSSFAWKNYLLTLDAD